MELISKKQNKIVRFFTQKHRHKTPTLHKIVKTISVLVNYQKIG